MTVDEYIAKAPEISRPIMDRVRQIIKELAPDVEESISYRMPAYKTNGKPLVYFGANKNHLGFYATPTGHSQFKDRLSPYKQGKGSVQFPYSKEIPYDLIREIVLFRVWENAQKNIK